jgi:hypothetical protein
MYGVYENSWSAAHTSQGFFNYFRMALENYLEDPVKGCVGLGT